MQRQQRPIYSPSHLNTYRSCPQKYYLKYVRKLKGRIFDRPAMTRGLVTHQVLAHAFKVFAGRHAFPGSLRADIEERVHESSATAGAIRSREVDLIHQWVDSAIESFDQRKTVHAVERSYTYSDRRVQAAPSFDVRARVDLVVKLDADEVEHVDWKTGSRDAIDTIQTVAARLGVGKALGTPHVRSTTVFLGMDRTDSSRLSKDDARATWLDIRSIVSEIQAGHASNVWPPIQSGLCAHCEYYQHGCVLHRPAAARQPGSDQRDTSDIR